MERDAPGTTFESLIAAGFQSDLQMPSEANGSSGSSRPTLLQTSRAVHESPETLVSTSITNSVSCQIPNHCLVGVVEGLPSAAFPNSLYWAATGQFLFLLGAQEVLLPPLGEVSGAAFTVVGGMGEGESTIVYGAIVTSHDRVSILRVDLGNRSAAVVGNISTPLLHGIAITRAPSDNFAGIVLAAICESSDTVGRIEVGLASLSHPGGNGTAMIAADWYHFPLTFKQRIFCLAKPTVTHFAYDSSRRVLSSLDTSRVLRSWAVGVDYGLVPAATGSYPDPVQPLALCPADPSDDFLFVVINVHGGRNVFTASGMERAMEGGGGGRLAFARQVLAPDGCDTGLVTAAYFNGITVFVFGDRYVTSTIAPAFIEPQRGAHEVVDVTLLGAGRVTSLIVGGSTVSVVTLGGEIYRLERRSDFAVFADMLTDAPEFAMDCGIEGIGSHNTCAYTWMLLPHPQAIAAAQTIIQPVIADGAMQLTPLVSVIVAQMNDSIKRFSSGEFSGKDVLKEFELLEAKITHLLEREGWCDTTYAESEVLELDVTAYPMVAILNKDSVSFGLAASIQGVLMSELLRSVRAAKLLCVIWDALVTFGVNITPSAVHWGVTNHCKYSNVRDFCFQSLDYGGLSALQALLSVSRKLTSWPDADVASSDGKIPQKNDLDDVVIALRVLSTAANGAVDDALALLHSYTPVLVRTVPSTLDRLLLVLNPFFPEAPLGDVRTLLTMLESGETGGLTRVGIRSQLHNLLRSLEGKGFQIAMEKVVEWCPPTEVEATIGFAESFAVRDDRLTCLAECHQVLVGRYGNKRRRLEAPTAFVFEALARPEPERSSRLAGIARSIPNLDLASRQHVLSLGSERTETYQVRRALAVQETICNLHPRGEAADDLSRCAASPTHLYALCSELSDGQLGAILQTKLLPLMDGADESVIYDTLTRALAVAETPGDFCDVLYLATPAVVEPRIPLVASVAVSRSDAATLISMLCNTSRRDEGSRVDDGSCDIAGSAFAINPFPLFECIINMIAEVEGSVEPGLLPLLFTAAQSARSHIEDTDLRNQCNAVLEDRANRLMQAHTFGQLAIPQSDLAILGAMASMARNEMTQPAGLYSEGTLVF